MDRDVLERMRALIVTERLLTLAVSVDSEPEAGLLPYAVSGDCLALYVQASGLARHARGLQPGARAGLLIHEPDSPAADPMQIARLTVQATVRVLQKGSAEFEAARTLFVARFPAADMTLALGDFNLYALTLGRGRYVEGFARAFNVGPDTFAAIGAL